MTTHRTTIEFERSTGIDAGGNAIIETVNAEVMVDGESAQIDLPQGGRWACDQDALRAATGTDLESTRAMLNRVGVVFEEVSPGKDAAVELAAREGDGPANIGYVRFVSAFGFNADGSLRWVGAWE